jgi:nitrile hydratase beta subunit
MADTGRRSRPSFRGALDKAWNSDDSRMQASRPGELPMNGIHDMGGITNFGPVRPEANEPVFHEEWQRRVFAMNMAAMGFVGPVDRVRHSIERMDAVEYLTTSYYEHWLHALATLAEELGYVSAEEIATGRAAGKAQLPHPAATPAMAEDLVRGGLPANREVAAKPAFATGDKVRARNLEVAGHTRLTRYVRGKAGTVTAYHACHVFPDTNAHDQGENPQPLYTVRFEADELWGDNVARRDCVHIDLWESYLEPLHGGAEPS